MDRSPKIAPVVFEFKLKDSLKTAAAHIDQLVAYGNTWMMDNPLVGRLSIILTDGGSLYCGSFYRPRYTDIEERFYDQRYELYSDGRLNLDYLRILFRILYLEATNTFAVNEDPGQTHKLEYLSCIGIGGTSLIYKVEANGKQYALKAFNERHEKLRETEVRAVQAHSKTSC